MAFLPLIVFILGLLIGSFLNVVILRMNTGRSALKGRSKCASCTRTLEWYELIPVFSFMSLRGKCRTCRTSISYQYPLVELISGLTFVLLYTRIFLVKGFSLETIIIFIFLCVVSSILLVITVYDLRHKIIPDKAVYTFILLGLVSLVWKEINIPGFSLIGGIISGLTLALPFFALWFFSKGKLMGFGDVKLALGIGWFLGLSVGFASMLLAFWIGGIFGLLLLAVSRKHSMRSEVPFAPFLILGMAIAGLWQITIQTLFPVW